MVGSACLIAALVSGLQALRSHFLFPLASHHGIDGISLSVLIGVQVTTLALLLPAAGAIADRYGAGRAVALGMLIYAAALALTGFADSPAFFFGAAILGSVGVAACHFVPVTAALGKKVGDYALTRVTGYI